MTVFPRVLLATAALALTTPMAFAHVTLATGTAPVGSTYKAVLQVPHGCEGAATTAIRVQVPEGFIGVKPQPKPGWTLTIKTGPYKAPHQLHGAPVTEGPVEIEWRGGELPDAFYDEFLMRGTLAADLEPGTVLYFPVIQVCGDASTAWIAIPAPGDTGEDAEEPAPGVTLTAPVDGGH